MKIDWLPINSPNNIAGLTVLLEKIPRHGKSGRVRFEEIDEEGVVEVARSGNDALIRYSRPSLAGRGLGTLLSGLVGPDQTLRETTPFQMFGVMLDCSRNAVMTAEHICQVWMPRLALLGYNTLMLYTEDTYELPGEPYFGYQRGAYTEGELRAIVDAADELNIEVIPCIQTLGHLDQILKHPEYLTVRDTPSVLMVGESETYALIEKMILHWSRICRTRRIHVGMDETHDLGRGRYLDRNGYRPGFDLFNEHLDRVVEICLKYKLKPMIWSDMYFRLGNKTGEYYDPATVIPPDVVRKIPREVDLVYWDYYHDDQEFYLDWIARHRNMGKEPLMGSGIWTWNRYWYDYRQTEICAGACVRACYKVGLKEVFFTMWGDNGAFCDHDSAFAGMVYCADIGFGAEKHDTAAMELRFNAVCGGSYAANRMAGELHYGVAKDFDPNLWDDPFFETHFRTWAKDDPCAMAEAARGFADLAARLKKHIADRSAGNILHAFCIADVFAMRYKLSADLLEAYRSKDLPRLKAVQGRIAPVVAAIRAAANSFRTMWLSHNKPEGLAIIQGRFGSLEARYEEMERRIEEFVEGKIDRLSELDHRAPPSLSQSQR